MKIFRINSLWNQESQDKKIREKLAGHTVPPPPFAWDKIERELDKSRPNKGRYILFFITLAACVAGITIGTLTFININNNNYNSGSDKGNFSIAENKGNIVAKKSRSEKAGTSNPVAASDIAAENEKINSEINNAENPHYNINNNAITKNLASKTTQPRHNNYSKNDIPGSSEKGNIAVQNIAATYKVSGKKLKTDVSQNKAEKQAGFNKSANEKIAGNQEEIKENIKVDLLGHGNDKNNIAIENDTLQTKTVTDSTSNIIANNQQVEEEKVADAKDKKPLANAEKSKGKWSFGIHAAAGISYRDITVGPATKDVLSTQTTTSTDPNSTNSLDRHKNDDRAVFSFSTGVSAGYNLNRHFSLHSGFYYAKNGYSSKVSFNSADYTMLDSPATTSTTDTSRNSNLIATMDAGTEMSSAGNYSFSNAEKSNINTSSRTQNLLLQKTVYNYFEWIRVPLQLRYTSADKGRISWFVQPGLSANFLVNKYAVLDMGNEKNRGQIVSNYNNFGIGANLSAGIGISLGKNLSLEVCPVFEYSLRSLIPNAGYGLHPYTFQLSTGLVKRF